MKMLVVHPGASWSTADVWRGYDKYLRRAGVQVIPYALDARIEAAGSWLQHCWQLAGSNENDKPSYADGFYLAGAQAIERALRFDVDWVLVISAMYIHPDVLVMLRRAGKRVAVLFTESPYDDEQQLHLAQYVEASFMNERSSLEKFRAVCKHSHYLAHAYDPDLHKPTPDDTVPAHDVVFVGTGFQERIDALSAVDWSGIDFGLYGAWGMLEDDHPLTVYKRNDVTLNEYAIKLYCNAKINLNMHRCSMGFGPDAPRITHAESCNPRVFELAACGAFQLTDWRAEMTDVFGVGSVPMYANGDMGDKIGYWLEEPAHLRQNIADAMRECVQGQTFEARVKTLLECLEKAI
jgi:spore maturation protein CgeB